MILLHLSDIHFGRNNPKCKVEDTFENKSQILQDLLASIAENTFKPEHIVVTGDIAWWGRKVDFDEALVWFKELLKITNLSGKDITFCSGNHDVNRAYGNYQTNICHEDIDTIDQLYKYENVHEMEAPLFNYDKFCEELGVIPYHYPKMGKWESSYSIGYKDIQAFNGKKIRIVSFNTALLSFVKDYPDDKMLIGQFQVMDLMKYGLIGKKDRPYTIAIFHHAERFLHPVEICEYNNRCSTLPLLRRNVDLVLCGHTETGGIPVLYKQIGGAEMLTGGAAYYSDNHENAYSNIIIPDSWPEGKEREICFAPFTYSSEQGWYMNIRKGISTKCDIIKSEQPQMECRHDFELILSYDEEKMTIPIKCVSVFMRNDNIAELSNLNDVCRYLDIHCSGHIGKAGTSNMSISVAKIKEYSVEALLVYENVFKFLDIAKNAKNGSCFKLIDKNGILYFSGENISCNEKIKYGDIEFLTQIRKIEHQYDLLFRLPQDYSEYKKVEVLNELIELGYTETFKAIPVIKTYADKKEQFKKLCINALKNKPIYVLYEGRFRCRLYGNDFLLGNIKLVMGPYKIKLYETIRKGLTYEKGDKRKLTLTLCKNNVCYFIADEQKSKTKELLNTLGECILFDNIECGWDFIYEDKKNVK